MTFRFLSSVPLVVLLAAPACSLAAQVPASAPTNAAQPAPAAAAASSTASSSTATTDVLGPALSQLQGTIGMIHVDKWKIPAGLRDESVTNVGSIKRDLDGTLPGLAGAADAAPGSVTALLPVFRNVNALYDVVLRVSLVAQMGAPPPQSAALTDSLHALEEARRTLGDMLAADAVSQDQQVATLKKTLSSRPPAPAPVVVVREPPPAAPAPKVKKKPKPKPAPAPTPSQ